MNYGERLELLQKVADREGKLPSALANRPFPTDHAAPYLTAFKRLHSSRIMGAEGAPSGIPLSEIEAYSRLYEFTSLQDRADLVYYVKTCDEVWLAEVKKRRKPVANPGKHPTSRR